MTIPPVEHDPHLHTQQPVIGVLLVHGFNGSRSDMAELEAYLRSYGVIAVNMLLPGHGLRVRDLMVLGWDDWAQGVRDELNMLKQRCDVVFLVGHSMGGSLVLHVAAHEEVAGVVAMCAPLHMHPLLKPIIRTMKYVAPLLPTIRDDVRDPKGHRVRDDVYRWTPMRPIESMLRFLPQLREELPRIKAPALIMTSVHDHVVPSSDGREIYRHIGSQEKYLVTLHRSYHIIMRDYDREEVFTKTSAFILRHARNATDLTLRS